jgi:hypothetical protein
LGANISAKTIILIARAGAEIRTALTPSAAIRSRMLRLPGEQEQRRWRKRLKNVDILQRDREIG